jgi:broad specificity phosphatase PhoE
MGNVDQSAYVTTADWRIQLTDVGKQQAVDAGRRLREKICEEDAKVIFYHSPYLRTKQTLDELIPYFSDDEILSCLEEPRICEQQIGNFQNVQQVLDAKQERSKFGRFFYRFPSGEWNECRCLGILRLVCIIMFTNCSIFNTGEAGLDVYNRVSSFIPTLVRDLDRHRRSGIDVDNLNVVIVTHGLSLRLFLSELFQLLIAYHLSCVFCHVFSSSHQSYTGLFSEMVPMECSLF